MGAFDGGFGRCRCWVVGRGLDIYLVFLWFFWILLYSGDGVLVYILFNLLDFIYSKLVVFIHHIIFINAHNELSKDNNRPVELLRLAFRYEQPTRRPN